MKPVRSYSFLLFPVLLFFTACNNSSDRKVELNDSITVPVKDTTWQPDTSRFFVIDTTGFGNAWNQYEEVKNLLEFHTRDSMQTDSTYLATLSMGKNLSSFELTKKVENILEPGGKVKVRDTSQEVTMYMEATLEDKASKDNPNFHIALVGGESNFRTYDAKKNKMVWQWNVTPKKAGHHELILSISHVDKEGIDLGSPESQRHTITIFASREKEKLGKGISGFFEKYWQWLLGAIALPIFLAWFTTRRRSQSSEKIPVSKEPNNNWKRKKRR